MPLGDSQKIKINTVTGGKDKDDLTKCFFYPDGPANTYALYKKENGGGETLLRTGITTGTSFSFPLNNYTWTVPDPAQPNNPFVISASSASGSWKNNDDGIQRQSNGESGTFQGQTGLPDPEEASSATA